MKQQHLHQIQIESINNNYRLLNGPADDTDDYNRTSSMKRQSNNNEINSDYNSIVRADDNEEVALNKQKHLSDWYYIKTSPKPKPSSSYELQKLSIIIESPQGSQNLSRHRISFL